MDILIPAVMFYAILMFLRFKTGARVYNLISIGVLLFLAFQYIDYIPMVITFTGLIIYSLWDTFYGGKA